MDYVPPLPSSLKHTLSSAPQHKRVIYITRDCNPLRCGSSLSQGASAEWAGFNSVSSRTPLQRPLSNHSLSGGISREPSIRAPPQTPPRSSCPPLRTSTNVHNKCAAHKKTSRFFSARQGFRLRNQTGNTETPKSSRINQIQVCTTSPLL